MMESTPVESTPVDMQPLQSLEAIDSGEAWTVTLIHPSPGLLRVLRSGLGGAEAFLKPLDQRCGWCQLEYSTVSPLSQGTE